MLTPACTWGDSTLPSRIQCLCLASQARLKDLCVAFVLSKAYNYVSSTTDGQQSRPQYSDGQSSPILTLSAPICFTAFFLLVGFVRGGVCGVTLSIRPLGCRKCVIVSPAIVKMWNCSSLWSPPSSPTWPHGFFSPCRFLVRRNGRVSPVLCL